ncbi:MAG: MYG1 family protein [Candidatus Taylorbacteria bacterium]|nr:MYG1 family protein [Candidatus Taylorbacteria bacterium]
MDKKVVIVTHDGMFHADDVFAVAALLCLLDTAPVLATIVRTRDEDIIRKADFVVDVGAVYDAEKNRFDHHQAGGAGKRPNGLPAQAGIPYAAFGLVWRKFGQTIALSEAVAEIVDQNLAAPIDAGDNGVDIYKKTFADVGPYLVDGYLHNIRPTWQEGTGMLDERFLEAVGAARQVLKREIAHAAARAAATALVRQAYDLAADKRLIALDAFYPHEKILAEYPEPLFVIFPKPDGVWNVKAIRDDTASFKNRKDLPADWAGKRDRELAELTGVPDALFCHNGRFMAVARSREGAIALAQKALQS